MLDSAQPQVDISANQPYEAEGSGSELDVQPEPAHDASSEAQTESAYESQEDALAQPYADTQQSGDDAPFLTVKYNKEQMPLSKEAAVTYAQKGMNYDKLSARLSAADEKLSIYESDDFFKIAQAYSNKSGRPIGDVMVSMRAQVQNIHGGPNDNQALIDAQLKSFMRAYPQVDPRRLPEGVLDAWSTGVPLSEAFLAYQGGAYRDAATERKTRLAREKTNRRNADASMGQPKSRGRAHERPLSDDAIRTMSPRELDRNHERIWAYLTGANNERR